MKALFHLRPPLLTNEDQEVAEKIEEAYQAIANVQQALADYKKKTS